MHSFLPDCGYYSQAYLFKFALSVLMLALTQRVWAGGERLGSMTHILQPHSREGQKKALGPRQTNCIS